jgi:cobalamin biosynthesis Co2+ chelatase CbiK
MLQKQYIDYIKEAGKEESQIFQAMVLVMPSDVKDTMSTNDRENWTRILAAQNPFKLYDHMKVHHTKAVSDQGSPGQRS